ncbi:hypothetical protein D3C87_1715970 [compost metagenome]
MNQIGQGFVQFGFVARHRCGRFQPLFGARLYPAQVLLLFMGQRQVLQHDLTRHRVHVEQLSRQRLRLVGVRQGQQLFGQAAGTAQLVDDGT